MGRSYESEADYMASEETWEGRGNDRGHLLDANGKRRTRKKTAAQVRGENRARMRRLRAQRKQEAKSDD